MPLPVAHSGSLTIATYGSVHIPRQEHGLRARGGRGARPGRLLKTRRFLAGKGSGVTLACQIVKHTILRLIRLDGSRSPVRAGRACQIRRVLLGVRLIRRVSTGNAVAAGRSTGEELLAHGGAGGAVAFAAVAGVVPLVDLPLDCALGRDVEV